MPLLWLGTTERISAIVEMSHPGGRRGIRSLEDLEHQASRVAPDPGAFSRKAQILVDVLALA